MQTRFVPVCNTRSNVTWCLVSYFQLPQATHPPTQLLMRELSAVAVTWLSAFVNSVHVSQHIISAGFSPIQCKCSFWGMWRSTLLHSYRHVFRCNDFMIPESRVLMQTTPFHPSHLASLLLNLRSTGRFDAACVITASRHYCGVSLWCWTVNTSISSSTGTWTPGCRLTSGGSRYDRWQLFFVFSAGTCACTVKAARGRWLECAKQDCQQIFVCMPLH